MDPDGAAAGQETNEPTGPTQDLCRPHQLAVPRTHPFCLIFLWHPNSSNPRTETLQRHTCVTEKLPVALSAKLREPPPKTPMSKADSEDAPHLKAIGNRCKQAQHHLVLVRFGVPWNLCKVEAELSFLEQEILEKFRNQALFSQWQRLFKVRSCCRWTGKAWRNLPLMAERRSPPPHWWRQPWRKFQEPVLRPHKIQALLVN